MSRVILQITVLKMGVVRPRLIENLFGVYHGTIAIQIHITITSEILNTFETGTHTLSSFSVFIKARQKPTRHN